jgi:transposase
MRLTFSNRFLVLLVALILSSVRHTIVAQEPQINTLAQQMADSLSRAKARSVAVYAFVGPDQSEALGRTLARTRSSVKITERTHEKQRKHYTPEEKVAILRRHLVEAVPISDLCDELGLQPTVFYRWQKEFFENGAAAFQQRGRTNHQGEQERIAHLEMKIQTKDEVLTELMAEHVALKKRVGEL